MDPVRRLTLALLLASVAALGASVDDEPIDAERTAHDPAQSAIMPPARLAAHTVYDDLRCTEPGIARATASLAGMVRP